MMDFFKSFYGIEGSGAPTSGEKISTETTEPKQETSKKRGTNLSRIAEASNRVLQSQNPTVSSSLPDHLKSIPICNSIRHESHVESKNPSQIKHWIGRKWTAARRVLLKHRRYEEDPYQPIPKQIQQEQESHYQASPNQLTEESPYRLSPKHLEEESENHYRASPSQVKEENPYTFIPKQLEEQRENLYPVNSTKQVYKENPYELSPTHLEEENLYQVSSKQVNEENPYENFHQASPRQTDSIEITNTINERRGEDLGKISRDTNVRGNQKQSLFMNIHEKQVKDLHGHEFSNLTSEVQKDLMLQTVGKIQDWITNYGQKAIAEAQSSNSIKEFKSGNLTFFATSKGKIYLNHALFGKGGSKVTYKVSLVAASNLNDLHEKFKALSLTSLTGPVNSLVDQNFKQIIDNELLIHSFLQQEKHRYQTNELEGEEELNNLSNLTINEEDLSISDSNQVVILTRFGDKGDVEHYLKNDYSTLPLHKRCEIAKGMAKGVAQLHEKGIVHRDIKPDNFIIKTNKKGEDVVKLIDFGQASFTEEVKEKPRLYIERVPVSYMDDQYFTDFHDQYRKSLDAYQLGITFYQLFTRRQMTEVNFRFNKMRGSYQDRVEQMIEQRNIIFSDLNQPSNVEKVKEAWPDFLELPLPLQDIIRNLVNPDSNSRPSIKQVYAYLNSENLLKDLEVNKPNAFKEFLES